MTIYTPDQFSGATDSDKLDAMSAQITADGGGEFAIDRPVTLSRMWFMPAKNLEGGCTKNGIFIIPSGVHASIQIAGAVPAAFSRLFSGNDGEPVISLSNLTGIGDIVRPLLRFDWTLSYGSAGGAPGIFVTRLYTRSGSSGAGVLNVNQPLFLNVAANTPVTVSLVNDADLAQNVHLGTIRVQGNATTAVPTDDCVGVQFRNAKECSIDKLVVNDCRGGGLLGSTITDCKVDASLFNCGGAEAAHAFYGAVNCDVDVRAERSPYFVQFIEGCRGGKYRTYTTWGIARAIKLGSTARVNLDVDIDYHAGEALSLQADSSYNTIRLRTRRIAAYDDGHGGVFTGNGCNLNNTNNRNNVFDLDVRGCADNAIGFGPTDTGNVFRWSRLEGGTAPSTWVLGPATGTRFEPAFP